MRWLKGRMAEGDIESGRHKKVGAMDARSKHEPVLLLLRMTGGGDKERKMHTCT